jgi:two-component system sensor histidine kinase CpxA
MASLTAEIVEMVRIEGEPQNQRWEAVGLKDVVEEVMADCRLEADARECRIQITGHVAGAIVCDRKLIQRALENVLRNAIRFSPEHAAIDLELRDSSTWVTLAVRDFGPGVPENTLERLFEPFFRVDAARDSDRGGVGLGLSIAKRAVVLHSGTITAQNAGPGLRVVVRLPRSPETNRGP